jgi:hypothetical protein
MLAVSRIVDKKSSTIAARRSGGKEIDDLLNGFVGAMVGGFELAGRLVMGVRAVVEAAVGERAAEPFVKEQEKQGDVNPFWGETVGVAGLIASCSGAVGSTTTARICRGMGVLLISLIG